MVLIPISVRQLPGTLSNFGTEMIAYKTCRIIKNREIAPSLVHNVGEGHRPTAGLELNSPTELLAY
jgi:hypothetical protein